MGHFDPGFVFLLPPFLRPFGAVHKLRLREEGGRWSKKLTFCKLLYLRKCKRRGVGGQKKPNLVNVVCERPLKVKTLTKCYSIFHNAFLKNKRKRKNTIIKE